MIPKIIWQTHELPYEELPDFQKKIIQTWKNLNPGYEHIYADAKQRSEDIRAFDKRYHFSYLSESKITQSDMWRHVMVYQHGGVYADMDSVCRVPIDYLIDNIYIDQKVLCAYKDGNGKVNSANFAAPKESSLMKKILDDSVFGYRMLAEGYLDIPRLPREYMCWELFSNTVLENEDKASFDFNCAIHDERYKNDFINFVINDYGDEYFYTDFLELKNLPLY